MTSDLWSELWFQNLIPGPVLILLLTPWAQIFRRSFYIRHHVWCLWPQFNKIMCLSHEIMIESFTDRLTHWRTRINGNSSPDWSLDELSMCTWSKMVRDRRSWYDDPNTDSDWVSLQFGKKSHWLITPRGKGYGIRLVDTCKACKRDVTWKRSVYIISKVQ